MRNIEQQIEFGKEYLFEDGTRNIPLKEQDGEIIFVEPFEEFASRIAVIPLKKSEIILEGDRILTSSRIPFFVDASYSGHGREETLYEEIIRLYGELKK